MLLALLAVLAIAFMQPLMTFVGGLTVLIGVGTLIFRDMSPADQDAVERRVLSFLRRARRAPTSNIEMPAPSRNPLPILSAEPAMPAAAIRRGRSKPAPPPES